MGLFVAIPFARAIDDQNQTIDAATVRALMDRVAQLEAEVKELKAAPAAEQKSVPTAEQNSTVSAANSTVSVNSLEHGSHTPMAHVGTPGVPTETYPSLRLRGFADVTFNGTDRPGTKSGFNMGQFVLHVASPLSKHISYFGEISLTAQPTLYNVDLERS